MTASLEKDELSSAGRAAVSSFPLMKPGHISIPNSLLWQLPCVQPIYWLGLPRQQSFAQAQSP